MIKDRRTPTGHPRYKRLCQYHYQHPDTVPVPVRHVPTPAAPKPHPSESAVTRMRAPGTGHRPPPDPPIPVPGLGTPVRFHDAGTWYTWTVPDKDLNRFQALCREDATPYRAATDPHVSRKYPTALVATLFARWRR